MFFNREDLVAHFLTDVLGSLQKYRRTQPVLHLEHEASLQAKPQLKVLQAELFLQTRLMFFWLRGGGIISDGVLSSQTVPSELQDEIILVDFTLQSLPAPTISEVFLAFRLTTNPGLYF